MGFGGVGQGQLVANVDLEPAGENGVERTAQGLSGTLGVGGAEGGEVGRADR